MAAAHPTLPAGPLRLPALGFGTWRCDAAKLRAAVCDAIRVGYRHIDTGPYRNEALVGAGIRDAIAAGHIASRADLWITGKVPTTAMEPGAVAPALRALLADLGTDYVDLLITHWPYAVDPANTAAPPALEHRRGYAPAAYLATWRAMEALVDEGLATNLGVSNFEIEHLQRIQAIATKPIAVNQFETQPYYQRTPLVNYCQEHGIVVTAHTSLGSPGNVMKSHHASAPLMQDPVVAQIAADVGRAPANVLLRWAVQRGTIVLPKSVTAARIASNADIFSFELSAAQMAAINALDKPGLEGCFNHPKTPWLGRGDFKPGEMAHYYQ
jgi:diketogulonate reductase-like aldo/keto reductase